MNRCKCQVVTDASPCSLCSLLHCFLPGCFSADRQREQRYVPAAHRHRPSPGLWWGCCDVLMCSSILICGDETGCRQRNYFFRRKKFQQHAALSLYTEQCEPSIVSSFHRESGGEVDGSHLGSGGTVLQHVQRQLPHDAAEQLLHGAGARGRPRHQCALLQCVRCSPRPHHLGRQVHTHTHTHTHRAVPAV